MTMRTSEEVVELVAVREDAEVVEMRKKLILVELVVIKMISYNLVKVNNLPKIEMNAILNG